MFRKRSHPCHTRRWMDILITKDGLRTMMDVIIVDLIHTNMVQLTFNDNTCNNDGCLGEDMIICWACTRWWLHSLCYWNIWVFSISFWFIFYHMCTYHYHMSFSPFDVCFLLLIVHLHNPTMCVNHNNFSTGCCTWPKFFIFSTQHNYCTYVTNWFVANDSSFILGFLCYRWLSFCSHESSLHKVLTWFLLIVCFCFFLLVVSICVFICLVLLMDGFPSRTRSRSLFTYSRSYNYLYSSP